MKKFLLTLCCIVLALSSFSQQTERVAPKPTSVLFEDEVTRFEYSDQDYENPSQAINHMFRVVSLTNKSDKPVTVSWFQEIHYGEKCANCDNLKEYTFSADLAPKQTITGDVKSSNQFLKTLVKDHNGWVVFNFSGLAINQVTYSENK